MRAYAQNGQYYTIVESRPMFKMDNIISLWRVVIPKSDIIPMLIFTFFSYYFQVS